MSGRLVVLLLVLSTCLVVASSQTNEGNPDLVLGIQAYKNAKYEEAVQHLERAVAGEPGNVQAHFYLASAFAQQYIPGSDQVSNVQLGNAATREYEKVLELDSVNLEALKGAAQLSFNMKDFDQAKQFWSRAIEIDPKDPEPYYSIAVVEWTLTYQPRMEQRAKLKLTPEQAMIFATECWAVRQANWGRVADGIEILKKAIDLRRDYDDAMAYMNLMYRERGDIQCGDPRAREADLRMADSWVDLTLAIKKQKAEKVESQQRRKLKEGQQGNITVEFSTESNPQ